MAGLPGILCRELSKLLSKNQINHKEILTYTHDSTGTSGTQENTSRHSQEKEDCFFRAKDNVGVYRGFLFIYSVE